MIRPRPRNNRDRMAGVHRQVMDAQVGFVSNVVKASNNCVDVIFLQQMNTGVVPPQNHLPFEVGDETIPASSAQWVAGNALRVCFPIAVSAGQQFYVRDNTLQTADGGSLASGQFVIL